MPLHTDSIVYFLYAMKRKPQVGEVRGYPDGSKLWYIEKVVGGHVQYRFVGRRKSFAELMTYYENYKYYGKKAPRRKRLLTGKVYV